MSSEHDGWAKFKTEIGDGNKIRIGLANDQKRP
jgi:hypothetical protein